MTTYRIDRFGFSQDELRRQLELDARFGNWPIVYVLDGSNSVYVGESRNASVRLRNHLDSPAKTDKLRGARVIMDDTFNKSVCLDLESFLIRLLAGDGRLQVLNRNDGITDANYYGRDGYRATFEQIFNDLAKDGLFTQSIDQIQNSDLFKLSPFKALTPDQLMTVEDIVEALFHNLAAGASSRIVIQGDPGTGKTIVGIYLMKLLSDIKNFDPDEPVDSDSVLSDHFHAGFPELLRGFRIGLVVPQQSLRASIRKVFKKTPGLQQTPVLSAYDVGKAAEDFDLLIIDEAHRLNRRAPQSSAQNNADFARITTALFGEDDRNISQLDWILRRSKHQIFLLDGLQSVRTSDLGAQTTSALVALARDEESLFRLRTQMRVQAGQDFVGYIRSVLNGTNPAVVDFGEYDLRMFDDLGQMRSEVLQRDQEVRLSRLLAGYAWPWKSRRDRTQPDIVLDGVELQWNSTMVDWVNKPSSVKEVGSIHTIQGYDLNYAGVIIGNDLRYDEAEGRMFFDRANYFDRAGVLNNPLSGLSYSDDDILAFVRNIYAVLLTRGILGTYLYVCDLPLRRYLSRFFPAAAP